MARRIYLAGPMAGHPDHNFPAFHRAAADLRAAGNTVYNPAEFPLEPDGSFPVRKAFAAYARFICEEADEIVLLPGFAASVGSMAELALARCCGLPALLWPSMARVA